MMLVKSRTATLAEDGFARLPEKGRSLWADALSRFARNRAAMMGVIILALVILFMALGPLLGRWTIEKIDWDVMGMVAEKGMPSLETGHYFGTDDVGRDLYSRVIQGIGMSLMAGLVSAGVAVAIGTFYGAVSGYFGGRIDSAMMRFVDILYAVPTMFLVIVILMMFGRTVEVLFVSLGAISWMGLARVVRGQTIALRHREFVEAAVAGGARPLAIVYRHVLPNLLGLVAVYASLLIPDMIMVESFLSFLGLGIQDPNTSLGMLISEGSATMMYGTLWQLAFPLFFFVLILFSLYFVGDGLRDALDPKDR
jgi:oligopeptide transport system permease protein